MRATTLLLTVALTLGSSTAFAQSSYNVVVEPVGKSIDAIINAPIEYNNNGVVKAQHFNADNLTDAEYQQIKDEAERVRAYRNANGMNFENEYVYPEAVSSAPLTTTYADTSQSYQIELFAPETSTPSYSTSSYATTTSASKTHTVSKGDTLYNISKRYDTSVQSIQAENGFTGTELSIGQRIRVPGVIVESINSASQPTFANSSTQGSYITRRVVEPTPFIATSRVDSVVASEAIYAVLPKDTLYSISRRSCVGVSDIISRNALANPNDLQPGQRITLPVGHCLAR